MTAVDLDAAAAAGPSARDRFSARDQIGKVMGDGGGDRLRARRDAILAFLVRCVSAALLYLTQVVMARWMGASEYGIYVTVWTAVIMLGGVTSLGLNLGVMRLVSVHREAGDMAALRGLMLGSRAIAVVMAVGFVMAGYAGLAVVQMSDGHRAAASIALLCLPLLAMTDMQDVSVAGMAG